MSNAATPDFSTMTRKQIVAHFAPLVRAAEKQADPTEWNALVTQRAKLIDR